MKTENIIMAVLNTDDQIANQTYYRDVFNIVDGRSGTQRFHHILVNHF